MFHAKMGENELLQLGLVITGTSPLQHSTWKNLLSNHCMSLNTESDT